MAFFNSALAGAEEEQARLRGQLKQQKLHCQRLAHLVAPGQEQEAGDKAPGSGGDSVPVETHQALQEAMDKLQVSASPRAPAQPGKVWGAPPQAAAKP